jgi:serine/threonine protein kinase
MANMILCPHCMEMNVAGTRICRKCGQMMEARNKIHQLPVGCVLNKRYLVGCAIGGGGFGITYVGYDMLLNIKVAVKEYYPSGAANRSGTPVVYPISGGSGNSFETGKKHFLSEAQILANFTDDPNIVTLRDYFEENGTAYIIMEFLEGQDLREYLNNHGTFSFDEALALTEPAIKALERVHAGGIIHGDISPSNIMRMDNGEVKILDFGTARTQDSNESYDSSMMLKPGYAPEEQFRQQGVLGTWTDVYAISATIYKLITGVTPENSTDRFYQDTLESPLKLGAKISRAQEAALLEGMAVNAKERTKTMTELLENLKNGRRSGFGGLRRLFVKPAARIAAAAAAVLVAAACFILPNILGWQSTGTSASEQNVTPHQERITAATLSDDAYPSPIYAEMELVQDFSDCVLVDDEKKTVTVTDCLIGNGMLALVVDVCNNGTEGCEIHGWSLEYGETDIDSMYRPGEYTSYTVAAGESESYIIWFSTDLMYVNGIKDFTMLNLTAYGYYGESEDYAEKHFDLDKTIYFPETVHINSKITANPVTLYSDDVYEITVYGVSLRRDGTDAVMIIAMRELKSDAESIYVTGNSEMYLNGERFFGNTSDTSLYLYVNYGQTKGFGLMGFKYAYSAPVDEMNVMHSGSELPDTLTVTLSVGTNYDAKYDLLEGKEITFIIDDNGIGIPE